MPVSPERQRIYPGGSLRSPEWLSIRQQIIDRDGHACKTCRVPNGAVIRRGKGENEGQFLFCLYDSMTVTGHDPRSCATFDWMSIYDEETGDYFDRGMEPYFQGGKKIKIVLTIAHLDHDPRNNHPGNLAALCQLHHNRLDAKMRADRRRMRHTRDLFYELG